MSYSREESMARMYGEACTKAQAARILNCAPKTVLNMLQDGRLAYACRGERVDVRSIARYIEAPDTMDEEARLRKSRGKVHKPHFAV